MQKLARLLILSALLTTSAGCPSTGNIKLYTILKERVECEDFRGGGLYRYDNDCKLLEYKRTHEAHQYMCVSPEDMNTILELIESCKKD